MACWAYMKPESELFEIFQTDQVPILSIIPIIPREAGCPQCYIVLGDQLSQEQVTALAHKLYHLWQPECADPEQARNYILEGLPLKTSHFLGVGTDDYFMISDEEDMTNEAALPRGLESDRHSHQG